jgi:sigma-B regulation protein RsbU (phosphoserine phosphatase)
VTVTTEMEPSHCRIAVHNAGAPIPAALRETLFEPMQRGDQEGAMRSVGLGLFIVREIARAHHGRVDVLSTADEGTTFSVHLPPAPTR